MSVQQTLYCIRLKVISHYFTYISVVYTSYCWITKGGCQLPYKQFSIKKKLALLMGRDYCYSYM